MQVRRKFAGSVGHRTHCFCFGGKNCGLSDDVLRDFGCMVLKKLDDGQTEEEVKAWVDEAVRRD
jgi:hypothetical protein